MNKNLLNKALDYAYIKKILKLKLINKDEYTLIKEKVDEKYL